MQERGIETQFIKVTVTGRGGYHYPAPREEYVNLAKVERLIPRENGAAQLVFNHDYLEVLESVEEILTMASLPVLHPSVIQKGFDDQERRRTQRK